MTSTADSYPKKTGFMYLWSIFILQFFYDTFNIDWVSITFSEHFSESITLEKGDENVRIHIEKII